VVEAEADLEEVVTEVEAEADIVVVEAEVDLVEAEDIVVVEAEADLEEVLNLPSALAVTNAEMPVLFHLNQMEVSLSYVTIVFVQKAEVEVDQEAVEPEDLMYLHLALERLALWVVMVEPLIITVEPEMEERLVRL